MAGSPKSPVGKLENLPLEVHLLVSAANVRFATDDRIIDTTEIINTLADEANGKVFGQLRLDCHQA